MRKKMLVMAALVCGMIAAQADTINLNEAKPQVITKELTAEEMNSAALSLFTFPAGITPASVRYVSVMRKPDGTGFLTVTLNTGTTSAPQVVAPKKAPDKAKK